MLCAHAPSSCCLLSQHVSCPLSHAPFCMPALPRLSCLHFYLPASHTAHTPGREHFSLCRRGRKRRPCSSSRVCSSDSAQPCHHLPLPSPLCFSHKALSFRTDPSMDAFVGREMGQLTCCGPVCGCCFVCAPSMCMVWHVY